MADKALVERWLQRLNKPGDSFTATYEQVDATLDGDAARNAQNVEELEAEKAHGSSNVLAKFGDDWYTNGDANIPHMTESIASLVDGRHKGQPAVLIGGAGDLYDSLDAIWQYKDRAHVFAVDAVWRAVPCDYVVNVDCQPKIMQHYTSAWSRAAGRTLITPFYCPPKLRNLWSQHGGNIAWTNIDMGHNDLRRFEWPHKSIGTRMNDKIGHTVPKLPVVANSTNTAMELLKMAGFGPIIVVGVSYLWRGRYKWDSKPNQGPVGEHQATFKGEDYHPDGMAHTNGECGTYAKLFIDRNTPRLERYNVQGRPHIVKQCGADYHIAGNSPGLLGDVTPFAELAKKHLTKVVDK